jgi:hypothetical protein
MRASGMTGGGGAIAGRIIGARAITGRSGAIAGRIVGARNALWEGAVRPPSKGPVLGGRLTRRDEPARCINDEDAGRNSNGHRPQLCLHCQRTAPRFRIIPQFQGASRFSAARISVPSLLLERAAMSRKASPTSAVHFLSIVA